MLNLNGQLIDPSLELEELERYECEESLYHFLTRAWKYIDPSPFVHGWPIEAVAEHLQAVCDGDIRRLLINIPPRCSKSTITSVCFPAWVWAQRHLSHTSGPGVQFLSASYAGSLSLRDSVKCRRLIDSPWYRRLWGDRFVLTSDQNTKGRFDNSEGGVRLATSVGSALTGEGMNIGIIDDPNGAQDATSEAIIESTIEWWDSAMSTRLNNPKLGAFIVIQQRLAENDLSGHILEKQAGDWTHLCLPMRYEKDRAFVTGIGWEDPRTDEGELLWPERFGESEIKTLERTMGPWAAAGQLQQRPEPKGGGVIKREWWQLWDQPVFPPLDYVIASLDTAYTEKTTNDYSALTVWGVFSGDVVAQNLKTNAGSERSYSQQPPRVMLMNAWADRLEIHELVQKVAASCKAMKVDKLLVENKAAGISVAQELRRLFNHEDWAVQLVDPKSQDKLSRLYSVQHLFAEQMVYAPDKIWSEQVITQCTSFPKGKHDDLVDTVSMALSHLRTSGLLTRGPEWTAEVNRSMEYHGKPPPPLYNV